MVGGSIYITKPLDRKVNMAGRFSQFAPTMVANGSKKKRMGNPLKGFYVKRNGSDDSLKNEFFTPEEDGDDEVKTVVDDDFGELGKAAKPERKIPAPYPRAPRPTQKVEVEEEVVVKPRRAERAPRATEQSEPKPKRQYNRKETNMAALNKMTVGELLDLANGRATGKAVKYPKLKIEVVGSGATQKVRVASATRTQTAKPAAVAAGGNRGRPKMTAEEKELAAKKRAAKKRKEEKLAAYVKPAAKKPAAKKPAAKKPAAKTEAKRGRGRPPMTEAQKKAAAKKRAALAKNPLRANGSKSDGPKPPKKPKETTTLGPYLLSLVRNPVTDFSIGGVKVLPASAAAAGVIALSHLVRNLPFVSEMKDGYAKSLAPSAVILGGAAALAWYSEKNGHTFGKELSRDMATFGLLFAVNDIVGNAITNQVDKFREPSAAAPALPATAPAAAGFSGGRFTSQPNMTGGAWGGAEALNGYITRGKSAGYPPMTGSGYPPAIEYSTEMMGNANGVNTAASIATMQGGRFGKQPALAGIDLGTFAD